MAPVTVGMPQDRVARAAIEPSAPYVYVLNGGTHTPLHLPFVLVYPPNADAPLRTISSTSTVALGGTIALDAKNALFIPQGPTASATIPYSIGVYAPGTTVSKRKITYGVQAVPSMAFDRRGKLYAVNSGQAYSSSVIEYDRGGNPIRQIRANANQVAVDSKDDVYVQALQKVLVYGPGSSTTPLRSIAHTPAPAYIAMFTLDPSRNLYIAYEFGQNYVVYTYGPRQLRPARKIHEASVCGLTTDARGRLYVLECAARAAPAVRIYAPGKSTPERTITAGLANPRSIAIDGSGYLYVGNLGPYDKRGKKYVQPSISVYAPGRTTPLRTITENLDGPIEIVFGSQ